MAAITRRRVGRPKLPGSLKSIRLRESVFNLWRDRKETLGLSQRTDSEFAEFLLHRGRSNTIHESAEVNLSLSCEEDNDTNPVPLFSTPIRANLAGESHSSCVDVTGISDLGKQREPDPGHSRSKLFDQTNNSFTGNPFSAGGFAIDDSLSEEDSDVSVEPTCIFDDHPFPDLEQTVNIIVEDLNRSDTSSDELSDDHSDYDEWHLDSYGSPEHPDVTQLFGENMDISSEEDERTLTMVDPSYAAEDDSSCVPTAAVAPCVVSEAPQPYYIHADDDTNHICGAAGSPTVTEALEQEVSMPQPEETTKPAEKHQAEILKKLEDAFQQLTSKGDLETFLALHSRMRVMVSINKLVELSEDKCALCGEGLHFKEEVKTIGSRVEIIRKCKNGHCQKWVSSEVLGVKNNVEFFLNDSLFAAAIIISGNNYSKFTLLCKALGLSIISRNTFTRFQKHCAAPVVKEIWDEMNSLITGILQQYDDLCLCGDGRNDSPGHSARYCVYTLMEHASKVVVDMAVVDKRETGGNSVVMEKEGLRRLLEKMASVLPFSELATDASSSIMKLVRDMKEKFPQLVELFHSLDIWHKAKKLSKCLHQAAHRRGCETLKEWIDDIVNHFWFCCQSCDGSVDELKETWFGVLHHVCGEHEWAGGACKHSPDETGTSGKTYLAKSSKALTALREVVLDKKWLNNLEFYVRFRHTSVLESYNSMLTKYAPKRMAFEYPYFIMRIMLAAIDHNMHLSRGKQVGIGVWVSKNMGFYETVLFFSGNTHSFNTRN
ncbi:uncharacterized protein [Montipora capricornis]|uniref:uncharacterized protein isoform X2 n=1 Tax=Montipora capricornis TaxID=246305 RepID=UPI0035F17F8B